jgi:hypothetical protein
MLNRSHCARLARPPGAAAPHGQPAPGLRRRHTSARTPARPGSPGQRRDGGRSTPARRRTSHRLTATRSTTAHANDLRVCQLAAAHPRIPPRPGLTGTHRGRPPAPRSGVDTSPRRAPFAPGAPDRTAFLVVCGSRSLFDAGRLMSGKPAHIGLSAEVYRPLSVANSGGSHLLCSGAAIKDEVTCPAILVGVRRAGVSDCALRVAVGSARCGRRSAAGVDRAPPPRPMW